MSLHIRASELDVTVLQCYREDLGLQHGLLTLQLFASQLQLIGQILQL